MAWDYHPACAEVEITDRVTSQVRVSPRRKKVAIIGFASNTIHLVPWFDPEFELWGMNQGHMNFARRADRWFEMHQPEATADIRDPDYITFLRNLQIPVYMIQQYDEYPTSLRYPIEDAINWVGQDYFMSSVAFMMVLAAMEGFEEIHLYGINLAIGDEYFYEKPNAEYLIGLLRGRGVKVYVPQASALLKQYRRYGYHTDARPNQSLKVLLGSQIAQYRSQAERAAGEANMHIGSMRALEALLQTVEGIDAGADLVLMPPQVVRPAASEGPTT